MKPIVILENIRSAYNVGNIIRTADALGYDVVLSGFSPSPVDNESVKKTSLGAEKSVHLQQFWHVQEALDWVREKGYMLVAAEVVEGESVSLSSFGAKLKGNESEVEESPATLINHEIAASSTSFPPRNDVLLRRGHVGIALVVGNEKTGVLLETLKQSDHIVHIPMQGEKESLNVGQAAAIMMWEFKKS